MPVIKKLQNEISKCEVSHTHTHTELNIVAVPALCVCVCVCARAVPSLDASQSEIS